jgi:hypothetical protein
VQHEAAAVIGEFTGDIHAASRRKASDQRANAGKLTII